MYQVIEGCDTYGDTVFYLIDDTKGKNLLTVEYWQEEDLRLICELLNNK